MASHRLVQMISSEGTTFNIPFRPVLSVRGRVIAYSWSEDGGSIGCPLKLAGEAAAHMPAGGCVRLAFTMQSEDFVILGGGSFKENAAMRPSDAFEPSIIERNLGV